MNDMSAARVDLVPLRQRNRTRLIISQDARLSQQGEPTVAAFQDLERLVARHGGQVREVVFGPGFAPQEQGDPDRLVVADLAAEAAAALLATAPPGVHVAEVQPLGYGVVGARTGAANPSVAPLSGVEFTARFRIIGPSGPVSGAELFLFGRNWRHRARTDANGDADIAVIGDAPDEIEALLVRPRRDHWSLHVDPPEVSGDARRVVIPPIDRLVEGDETAIS